MENELKELKAQNERLKDDIASMLSTYTASRVTELEMQVSLMCSFMEILVETKTIHFSFAHQASELIKEAREVLNV